jgi:hypothetical protein
MKTMKLTSEHKDSIKHLFNSPKFMGVPTADRSNEITAEKISNFYHQIFCQTYLSDSKNYHAFAAFDDTDTVVALIGFYESNEDPSWYWTHVKSSNSTAVKIVLDAVVEHNENNKRFKFFSMFPLKYDKAYRRLAFSKKTSERYGAFNEFYVKARERCLYTLPWQILYNRVLLPVDTVVRCTYLKPEYRTLVSGGNL